MEFFMSGSVENPTARRRLPEDAAAPPISKLNSSSNPPLLPPSLTPSLFSPSSFFVIPPGISPSQFLDSPVFLNSSHILTSSSAIEAISVRDLTRNSNNFDHHQHNIKQELNILPEFSLPRTHPTKPSSSSSSIFQSSSTLQNQPWEYEAAAVINGGSATNHRPQSQSRNRASEDGYNWRKYGQKVVKGSKNPRSYYKCTQPNCPVRKQVEKTINGQITEIVYKSKHNHPKPDFTRRRKRPSPSSSSSEPRNSIASDSIITTPQNSSITIGDYDPDENGAKKLKSESENGSICGGGKTVREQRIVVQTISNVDKLDDGYWWRKYGEKVVKGNPNPRSYYKCTYAKCGVRKHIERAPHDSRAVITTYEGKHNHDIPASRGGGGGGGDGRLVLNNHGSNNEASNSSGDRRQPGSEICGGNSKGLSELGSNMLWRTKEEVGDDIFMSLFG